MDNDLNVKDACDELFSAVRYMQAGDLSSAEASDILQALKHIDEVLGVIF